MQIRLWNNNLKVRLIGEALFNMLFWMYFPFITVYFGTALGNNIASILMTIPPLVSLIGSLIGGSLTDRLGRRPVMLLGALLQTIMFALFALSPSYWIDYAAFIGISFGGAIYRPASSTMVADLVPKEHLREVFATFTTANNIGAVLGPVLGAIFFFQYRQELLWSCSLILLLYFVFIYFIVDETRPSSTLVQNRSVSPSRTLLEHRKEYAFVLHDKVFLVYIVAGIFSLIPIMQLDLYLPIYVINSVPDQAIFTWKTTSLTLSSTEIYGWLVGFNGLLFVLFILPVNKWLRNWKERNIFVLSSLLSGFGTFFVGLNTNVWFLFFVTIIFTFGEIVRSPVTQSFISHYAPENSRGKYMAADSMQNTIGKFLAPVTVFLSSWISPIGIFSIILGFSLISIYFYMLLFKMYKKKNAAKTLSC